jgi:DNA (cytosine-5)-methyltransferase 1
MKFIDLFSGIGGFRIALESVGATCVFSSDIDKDACKTYQNNFGEYPYSDIKTILAKDLPDFDILCAGFPCQPFSIAGKRKGFSDTRGTLFFDIERIIREKKPRFFILENVKGLVNHNQGKTLKIILNILAAKVNGKINNEAADNCLGYNIFFKVLNSKNYGVPQNRERIFIIGFSEQDIKFNFPIPLKRKVMLKTILEKNIKEHFISDIASYNILNNLKKHKKFKEMSNEKNLIAYEIRKSKCSYRYDGISPTLTAKMGTGGNNVPVLVSEMRKFSTKECLKIQGFPKNFKIKENNSLSYKQIGNSVSVPVVKMIAKEMAKFF